MAGVMSPILKFFAPLGIITLLAACAMPLDDKPYLEDPKVIAIIENNKEPEDSGDVSVDITPPTVVNIEPILTWDEGSGAVPLGKGDTKTLSQSGTPHSATVTVSNSAAYTSPVYEWYCNNNGTPAPTGGVTYTITAGTAPFIPPASAEQEYFVAVEVTAGGIPYSTWFKVKILP